MPVLLDLRDIPPNRLAALFLSIMTAPSVYEEGRRRLRDRLLDLTLRTARAQTQYYRDTLPDRPGGWDYDSFERRADSQPK